MRTDLVGLKQLEKRIVVFAASARLHLHSSNSAWVSNFFRQGILVGILMSFWYPCGVAFGVAFGTHSALPFSYCIAF